MEARCETDANWSIVSVFKRTYNGAVDEVPLSKPRPRCDVTSNVEAALFHEA